MKIPHYQGGNLQREAAMSNPDGTSKTCKKVMVSLPLQGVLRKRSDPLREKQFTFPADELPPFLPRTPYKEKV